MILGNVAKAVGDRDQCLALVREALDVACDARDAWLEVVARALLCDDLRSAGDLTAGRRMAEEALRGAREVGDLRYIGHLLTTLGSIAIGEGGLPPGAQPP